MRALATLLLLTTTLASAQTPATHAKDQLRFTLVLSRHGVRPPLSPTSRLDLQSSDPWPDWEVPLGYLTPHGALAIHQMGAYMRLDFARNGLLPATGCPTGNQIYLYADTDERNIESTRNTFAGLAPGCDPLPIHTIVPDQGARDPLFTPIPNTPGNANPQSRPPASFFSVAANPELTVLAQILAPDPAHPPAKPILDDPNPLNAASSLVEDIFLEYIDAKPMSQVAWGRVDEPTLRRLLPLHIKQFAVGTRDAVSTGRDSDLMAHILATLEQAIQVDPVPGAIAPIGTRLVYLSGHDSNLFRIAGLLSLHWTLDGRTDDTPPDSQLVFELWQNPKSKQYTVRIRYRAQTIDQLRSAEALTLKNPPPAVDLTPPGCQPNQPCPLAAFDKATHALLDPNYIQPTLTPTHIAPPNP
jgi:4-phytase/acid phosphatase